MARTDDAEKENSQDPWPLRAWDGFREWYRDKDHDGLSPEEEAAAGTSNTDSDSDDDGVPDKWEVEAGTDPTTHDWEKDDDFDGLTNKEEYELRTDPKSWDSDGDFLMDSLEVEAGTDPRDPDTDGDGVPDGFEYGETDPKAKDSDRDGVPDGQEDPDGDGLSTAREIHLGTKPYDPDSDKDGRSDGEEYRPDVVEDPAALRDAWRAETAANEELIGDEPPPAADDRPVFIRDRGGRVQDQIQDSPYAKRLIEHGDSQVEEVFRRKGDATGELFSREELPRDAVIVDATTVVDEQMGTDADGDGLTLAQEKKYGTDPDNPDSDGDGLPDSHEVLGGNETDPWNPDTDGDGMLDGAEVRRGFDPLDPDSDDDGILDGLEVAPPAGELESDSDTDEDGDGVPDQFDPDAVDVEPGAPEVAGAKTDPEAILRGERGDDPFGSSVPGVDPWGPSGSSPTPDDRNPVGKSVDPDDYVPTGRGGAGDAADPPPTSSGWDPGAAGVGAEMPSNEWIVDSFDDAGGPAGGADPTPDAIVGATGDPDGGGSPEPSDPAGGSGGFDDGGSSDDDDAGMTDHWFTDGETGEETHYQQDSEGNWYDTDGNPLDPSEVPGLVKETAEEATGDAADMTFGGSMDGDRTAWLDGLAGRAGRGGGLGTEMRATDQPDETRAEANTPPIHHAGSPKGSTTERPLPESISDQSGAEPESEPPPDHVDPAGVDDDYLPRYIGSPDSDDGSGSDDGSTSDQQDHTEQEQDGDDGSGADVSTSGDALDPGFIGREKGEKVEAELGAPDGRPRQPIDPERGEGVEGRDIRHLIGSDDLAQPVLDADVTGARGDAPSEDPNASSGMFGTGAIDMGPDHVEHETGRFLDEHVPGAERQPGDGDGSDPALTMATPGIALEATPVGQEEEEPLYAVAVGPNDGPIAPERGDEDPDPDEPG